MSPGNTFGGVCGVSEIIQFSKRAAFVQPIRVSPWSVRGVGEPQKTRGSSDGVYLSSTDRRAFSSSIESLNYPIDLNITGKPVDSFLYHQLVGTLDPSVGREWPEATLADAVRRSSVESLIH